MDNQNEKKYVSAKVNIFRMHLRSTFEYYGIDDLLAEEIAIKYDHSKAFMDLLSLCDYKKAIREELEVNKARSNDWIAGLKNIISKYKSELDDIHIKRGYIASQNGDNVYIPYTLNRHPNDGGFFPIYEYFKGAEIAYILPILEDELNSLENKSSINSINKNEAKSKKNQSELYIETLTQQLKILDSSEIEAQSWLITTQRLLNNALPKQPINLAKQRIMSSIFGFSELEKKRFKDILIGCIKELELNDYSIPHNDNWTSIHPIIINVAKSRFESQHYADSVEAAFKELNDVIKQSYKKDTGAEEDGDSLMRKAFSVKNPVYLLADNSNDSGKNIQQGYMDIFAGAMKGIRNPKAHSNIHVTPEEAWEMIILASHLARMWDKTEQFKR